MSDKIKHKGIVDDIDEECVKVRIVQTSACASCQASGHCSAAESKEKVVEIYDKGLSNLKKGDSVTVVASQRTGFIAVMLSSVIPLIILVAVLVSVLVLTGNEVNAALISICALIPYYLIIYMLKRKIQSRLSFHIEME